MSRFPGFFNYSYSFTNHTNYNSNKNYTDDSEEENRINENNVCFFLVFMKLRRFFFLLSHIFV